MARKSRKNRLDSRDRWIEFARDALIADGAGAISIGQIGKKLGVTRGVFYWWFRNLADLHNALLKDWQEHNNAPYLAALSGPGKPIDRFWRVVRLWNEEGDYDPAYDMAVRNWAHTSAKVAKVVKEVDNTRIDAFRSLLIDAGTPPDEAVVRARLIYFSQVGYFTLGVRYPDNEKVALTDVTIRIMTGLAETHESAEASHRQTASKTRKALSPRTLRISSSE